MACRQRVARDALWRLLTDYFTTRRERCPDVSGRLMRNSPSRNRSIPVAPHTERVSATLLRRLLPLGPLVIVLGASCARTRALSPKAQAQWIRDSLDYEGRVSKWVYDSTVIDSIVRSIPTDSLAHLYERMLASDMPEVELQLIFCEQVRLGRRYGSEPTLRASDQVRDSVYDAVGGAAVSRMRARMPHTGRITSSACPKAEGAPTTVTPGGTRLDVLLRRPRPPSRP